MYALALRSRRTVVLISSLVSFFVMGLLSPGDTAAQRSSSAELKAIEQRVAATVRERGSIASRQAMEVHSRVGATILYVAPEGDLVEQGDLVVELDASALHEQHQQHRVALVQLQARLEHAQARVKTIATQQEMRRKLDALKLQAITKERERILSDDGELALQLKQAQTERTFAEARLKAAQRSLNNQGEGTISPAESAALLTTVSEAAASIELAEAKRRHLSGPARELAELNSQVALAQAEYEAQTASSDYRQRSGEASAERAALQAELQLAQSRLADAERRLSDCKIYAPGRGIVEHVTSSRTRERLEVGSEVRRGQPLVKVVNMEQLVVRVAVNESRIARLAVGQGATIRIDAFPGQPFRGQVEQVGQMPEPTSFFNADVRSYPVLVSLDAPPNQLRLGLTALVEIDTQTDPRD